MMSIRKKTVLIVSVCVFVLLGLCTAVSFQVYKSMRPKVTTFSFEISDLGHLNIMQLTWYLPPEAIFANTKGEMIAYRLEERSGRFGSEYFADEIPVEIYYEDGEAVTREEDGYIRVEAPLLQNGDDIIRGTDMPLKNNETVTWLNPETSLRYSAD